MNVKRNATAIGAALLAAGCALGPFAGGDELVSAYPVEETPHELTPLMERELRGCFEFFWQEWVSDPSLPTCGMTCGDYVGMNVHSPIPIEEQGFYFTAIVSAVERGWVSRSEGYERVLLALKSIRKLKNFRGHYYHFYDKDGRRGWHDGKNVEVTNVGTATMIAGAIVAGEYFGGEVAATADELYQRIDWKWFTDPVSKHCYLACYPEDVPPGTKVDENGFFGAWAAYSEHIILYVLGAGAPVAERAIGADSYYNMITYRGRYKGDEFIYCTTGAAFTYQWTHCFVDFRNIEDRLGRNWFDNSRHAAIAARQYAIDKANEIKGLGPDSWGLSACISPSTGYSGAYGSLPAGTGADERGLLQDGTVAPYASSGFVVFTPEASIESLEYMYTIPGLVGKYGLYDAYSFKTKADGDKPWIGASYLGIDKGIVSIMFENYSSQLIWKLFHQNRHVQRGLEVLEFSLSNDDIQE